MNEPTVEQLRELDAWIAENVMGWDLKSEPFRFFRSHDGLYFPNADGCGLFWHPSTSPSDAMDVLKKCNEMINRRKYREVIGIATLMGSPMVGYDPEQIWEHAETLELAICRFAKSLFEKGVK